MDLESRTCIFFYAQLMVFIFATIQFLQFRTLLRKVQDFKEIICLHPQEIQKNVSHTLGNIALILSMPKVSQQILTQASIMSLTGYSFIANSSILVLPLPKYQITSVFLFTKGAPENLNSQRQSWLSTKLPYT